MQFDSYKQRSNVPNLTPLIDIVFLLLVFFMLTSHFVREETISIDLPSAETAQNPLAETTLEIRLSAAGDYYFNDQLYNETQLLSTLTTELARQSSRVVYIRGDKSSNLGSAIHLIDIARKAGAESVDVITEKHERN